MAAEVVTAIKTVSALVDVMWKVWELTGRYRDLRYRLVDIAEALEACEVTLSVWKSRWCIRDETSHAFYEYLWSQRGWQAIQHCLGGVDEISKLLHLQVNGMIGTAFLHQGHAHRERYNGNYNSARFKKAMERVDRHMSRRKRFLSAVMFKADGLDQQLSRFEKKITTLERLSIGHVLTLHPTLEGEAVHTLPIQARRRVEVRIRQEERNIIKGNRKDAGSLHNAFLGCDNLDCHLALARVDPAARRLSAPTSQLYFLLANSLRTTEIHFKPVDILNARDIRRASKSLAEAYTATTAARRDKATDLIPPHAQPGEGFELRVVERSSLVALNRISPLSILLASQPRFNARQMLAIAVSLVEGCHRFLGTPWLNHLDSSNVRGEQDPDSKAWTVMLAAAPGNRNVTQALAQFSSQPSNRRRDLGQHTQLYRLGIVLAELALGSLVTYADASSDPRAPGVSVVMRDYAPGERLDAGDIAGAVEDVAGETYASFVEFCLNTLQDRRMIQQRDFMQEYEDRLLDPARAVKDLIDQAE
nr:hypothetical protein B0A51_07257 [Rachicladosporium sp. CCFEE 5018]